MAVTVTHNFVSPIVDQADPTLLGPDEWNDSHATSMATNKLLGRATAGTGAVEEITLGTNLSYTGTTLNATGSGTPGGADTQVQFNNAAAFGGDDEFTYDSVGGITLGKASGGTGTVKLKGTTSGTVTVKAQDAAGTWTLKVPDGAGTNGFVLQTDGAGVTSWVAQTGAAGSLTVGTTTISGGTVPRVLYEAAGNVVGEAASFTISSGQPNVASAKAYLYNGTAVLSADPAVLNYFVGPCGNFTATGTSNIGLGDTQFGLAAPLSALTSGNRNVMIGPYCGGKINSGSQNIGIGPGPLAQLTTGGDNVAIGNNALAGAAAPSACIAIGNTAMQSATGGTSCIAIGAAALMGNTSGANNVALGDSALNANTSGSDNFGLGFGTLAASTTGGRNVAIGASALSVQTVAGVGGNVAIGWNTGIAVSSGTSNTLIGYNVTSVTTGGSNTFIGAGTGGGVTTGSNNTIIGAGVAGLAAGTASNIILADGAGNIRAQYSNDNTWSYPTTNVAGLPTAGTAGRRAFVTDATVTTFASVVAGTGGNGVPVYDDGTNWRIG